MFLSASAAAQSISVAGGASSSLVLVDPQEVMANAREGFDSISEHLRQELTGDGEPSADLRSRLTTVVSGTREDFLGEVRLRVRELQSDGVLEAGEVSKEIGKLRDGFMEELRQALVALLEGTEPPPLLRDYTDEARYLQALLTYTLAERNPWTRWLYLVAWIAGGMVAAWLGNTILRNLAGRLKYRRRLWEAEVMESLSGPLYLAAVMLGLSAGLGGVWVPGIAYGSLETVFYVGLTTAIFWFTLNTTRALATGIGWVIRKTYGHEITRHMVVVIARILRVTLLVAYVLIIIKVVLDSNLTGLLAGLGVAGLALSFILKGTIENIAASFTIFGDKPFRIGDLILYREEWGYVEDVGFRSTKFRTLEGHLLNIPNAALIEETLHNVGARPYIRRRFRISLTYDTPPQKVRKAVDILQDILKDHPGQPDDHPPHVVFESYGAYDLRLLVQYYFQPPDYWKALEQDTDINLQILERFNEAGIEFAFPTQTNRLKVLQGGESLPRDDSEKPSSEPDTAPDAPPRRDTTTSSGARSEGD